MLEIYFFLHTQNSSYSVSKLEILHLVGSIYEVTKTQTPQTSFVIDETSIFYESTD